MKKLPIYEFLDKIDNLIKNGVDYLKKEDLQRYNKIMEALKRCRHVLGIEFLEDDPKDILGKLKEIMGSGVPKAFLFGAGISAGEPFSLPTWSNLLQRSLLGVFFKDTEIQKGVKFDKFLGLLKNTANNSENYFNSFDFYELAQFIEDNRRQLNCFDDSANLRTNKEMQMLTDSEMFEIVKTSLVLSLKNNDNKKINWRDVSDLLDSKKIKFEKNSLISYLARSVNEYNVKRILTYNYDNAFEYTCEKIKLDKKIQTVFLDNQLAEINDDIVPVFHVHGYIPIFADESSKKIEYFKKYATCPEIKKLILSEESYNDIEHSSYKWRNVIQIDTFLRYNCIFFGFSATDKNFKRIVKLMDWNNESHNQDNDDVEPSVRHYIFLDVDDYIENIFNLSLSSIINKEYDLLSKITDENGNDINTERNPFFYLELFLTRLQFLYFTLRTKRKYLKKLHIYPIWVTRENVVGYLKKYLQ